MSVDSTAETSLPLAQVAKLLSWGDASSGGIPAEVIDGFIEFLTNVTADPAALDEIAARSFLHYNGFLKVVLLPASTTRGFAVRIHSWHKIEDSDDADPHDHRWPYISAVLSGVLREFEYETVRDDHPGAVPALALKYHSDNNASAVFYVTSAGLAVRQKGYLELREGSIVRASASRIHRVQPAIPNTSTMVITGTPEADKSTIYRVNRRIPPTSRVEAVRPSAADILKRLEESLTGFRRLSRST